MKQDNNKLKIECNGFMTDNENKSHSENKVINDPTKSGWENKKTFEGLKDKNNDKWKVDNKRSAEDWTMVNHKQQKNIKRKDDKKDIKKASKNKKYYYNTLSEDEKETKEKDQDKDSKDRKSTEIKEMIAYMTMKNFSQRKKKKNKDNRGRIYRVNGLRSNRRSTNL